MTAGGDEQLDDDDLIAVVRAGLQELQPDVTHRVDHHRFWRAGRRRRQRRLAVVTTSVVATLTAVLVPLVLVAVRDDDHDHGPLALARPTATPVAGRTTAAVLSETTLAAALQQAAPTASVTTQKAPVGAGAIAGSAVTQHLVGVVQLGVPGKGLSLEVNAYRLFPTPSDAQVLSYFHNVLSTELVQTTVGGGVYWLPRQGNDGAAARTAGGAIVVVTGTLPKGSAEIAQLQDLMTAVAKGLAGTSL